MPDFVADLLLVWLILLWRITAYGKNETEIHVTTVFDGELDATDVFVSLIAQKYGQNISKENLAKTQDLEYNKDEVQKNRVPSGLCG
mgnify:FL=1